MPANRSSKWTSGWANRTHREHIFYVKFTGIALYLSRESVQYSILAINVSWAVGCSPEPEVNCNFSPGSTESQFITGPIYLLCEPLVVDGTLPEPRPVHIAPGGCPTGRWQGFQVKWVKSAQPHPNLQTKVGLADSDYSGVTVLCRE